MHEENEEQQQEDWQPRTRVDLGEIERRLVVDELTRHALVVSSLGIVPVQQPGAMQREHSQQHALENPAGPTQSSITASLAHTLPCTSPKSRRKA